MKPLCTAIAAILLAGLCRAADPASLSWRADLSTTEVRNLYLRHGDTATLRAHLYLRGQPYVPTNAVCYFSTNGLASSQWWTARAAIESNVVSVAWTPLLERTGVNIYPLVLRIDESAYRAAAMLYLRSSPGDTPAADGFILDFNALAYTNAPWATPQDAVRASSEAIYAAVTVLDSGHVDTVAEIRDTLLELIEQLKRINAPGEHTP